MKNIEITELKREQILIAVAVVLLLVAAQLFMTVSYTHLDVYKRQPSEREAVRAKSKERLDSCLSFLAYHLWSGAFVSGFRTLSFDFFQ